jgi:hypothetical protein
MSWIRNSGTSIEDTFKCRYCLRPFKSASKICEEFFSQLLASRRDRKAADLHRFSDSVADPDRGSGIRCLYDPWIRDPGWVKKIKIRIRDPDPD